ncbi:MAG TPA: CUAEP/CCAEP-tail radical SAM protein [Candidatus Acidoferrales bacterium]
MNVVLISTYELGRQPFGVASPAAWLRQAGASVTSMDLSRAGFGPEAIGSADLVAFYVPMHTATRLATRLVGKVRALNPRAHLCFYGLYAPVNERFLRRLGAETILGGEFEEGLVKLVERLRARIELAGRPRRDSAGAVAQPEPVISLARQKFQVPDREGLPELSRYARLICGDGTLRTVGYTEASRGCKHLCRHCPIVPVYRGQFRIVQPEVVLEDIRRQVARGAQHITFGDPDFFNGVGHSVKLVEALHREHPDLTYDVTIKIEHLLGHSRHLATLRDTGCLFVTSAVESIDDRVLNILDKGHSRADFIEVTRRFREVGLNLSPTFVTFTPWTTLEGYRQLLSMIAELDLVNHVAPIQLAIRLLIPAGSRLLELAEVRELVGEFDEASLVYPWVHEDRRVEKLCRDARELVRKSEAKKESRETIFSKVWALADAAGKGTAEFIPTKSGAMPQPGSTARGFFLPSRATIPYLNEPWYC